MAKGLAAALAVLMTGDDPHDNPRSTPSARVQKSEFLKVGGAVVDVCGGRPCFAAPYTGP